MDAEPQPASQDDVELLFALKENGVGPVSNRPVQHLARRQPGVALDCLLSDVGENRIGASECDHRNLA